MPQGGGTSRRIAVAPYLWLISFFVVPFLLILKISLSDQVRARPPYFPQLELKDGFAGFWSFLSGLDFENYRTLLTDSFYFRSYLLSLETAVVATTITLLIAYPMAYGLTRAPQKWRNLLLALVVLPFWISFLIRVYAWISILKPNGFLDMLGQGVGLAAGTLALLNSKSAVIIGIVYSYLPFMVLPLFTVLDKLDDSLIEASRDLGASTWRTFISITLPLSLPGIYAGCLLAFIPMVGEFVIPDLLGGNDTALIGKTLWTEFFNNQDWPLASAIAIGMLFLLLLPIAALQKAQARADVRQNSSGSSADRTLSAFNLAAVVAGLSFIYLPIILVMAFSFNDSRLVTVWAGFSLKWYGLLFQNTQLLQSALMSLKLAILSATAAAILGILAALAMVRVKDFRGMGLFGFLVLAPIIIPEMVIGLALLLLFVAIDLPRGFFTLFLAHTTFGLCFVATTVKARLSGFDTILEEASADLGASGLQTFWRITFPLILPGVLSGWALAFVLSFDDLIISSLVTGPGATTLPMRLYSQMRLGVTPEINAASTLMVVAAVTVLFASLWLEQKRGANPKRTIRRRATHN
jgi:ABC-type spermidine/putrescine transport system permease subunit I